LGHISTSVIVWVPLKPRLGVSLLLNFVEWPRRTPFSRAEKPPIAFICELKKQISNGLVLRGEGQSAISDRAGVAHGHLKSQRNITRIRVQENDLVPGRPLARCAMAVISPHSNSLPSGDAPAAALESPRGMSAIRVCDQESEPAGLNHRLTVPAHPRHDLLAVVFCCSGHDRLVVTVSKREPSLTHLSGGFQFGAGRPDSFSETGPRSGARAIRTHGRASQAREMDAPSPAINKGRGVSVPRFLSGAIGLDRMRQENARAK
jgi:hypothetical protein